MKAMYFMGTSKGTSKKGNVFWCVNVLWLNSFGNYEIKPLFVNEDMYGAVNEMGLARGTAVTVTMNLGGGLDDLTVDPNYKILNLGEPVKR